MNILEELGLHAEKNSPHTASTKSKSKSKGNAFERDLCKVLQDWTGFKFIRVPLSGGFRGIDSPYFIGDVVVEDFKNEFPFTVEAKYRKELNFKMSEDYVLKYPKTIIKFWQQVSSDCKRSGKKPILFTKTLGQRSNDWVVFITEKQADILVDTPIFCKIVLTDYKLVGYRLKHFLKTDFKLFTNEFFK